MSFERETGYKLKYTNEMGQIKVIMYIRKVSVKAESQVNCSGLIINRRLVEYKIGDLNYGCQCLLQNYNH